MEKTDKKKECILEDSCEQVINTCITIKILLSETKEYYEITKNLRNSMTSIQKKLGSRVLEIENQLNRFEKIINRLKECSNKKDES